MGEADHGVCHRGHPPGRAPDPPQVVFIDEDLLRLEVLWAAAGTPHAVFRVGPAELVRISGGTVVRVRSGAG
ncbi:MAG: hypothetical protein NVS3B24_16960 [Candidatus Dormibacteria bacterium]